MSEINLEKIEAAYKRINETLEVGEALLLCNYIEPLISRIRQLETQLAHCRKDLHDGTEAWIGCASELVRDRAALGAVAQVADAYAETWAGEDDRVWLDGLEEEVNELHRSLFGLHCDSPEHELLQIASIALNWLRHRKAIELPKNVLVQRQ